MSYWKSNERDCYGLTIDYQPSKLIITYMGNGISPDGLTVIKDCGMRSKMPIKKPLTITARGNASENADLIISRLFVKATAF